MQRHRRGDNFLFYRGANVDGRNSRALFACYSYPELAHMDKSFARNLLEGGFTEVTYSNAKRMLFVVFSAFLFHNDSYFPNQFLILLKTLLHFLGSSVVAFGSFITGGAVVKTCVLAFCVAVI